MPSKGIEVIGPTLAEQIGPHLNGDRWRKTLLSGGALRDVAPTADGAAPQTWLAAIRGLVDTLALAEDEVMSTRRTPAWSRFSMPPYWYVWLPGLWVVSMGVALTMGESFGDRAMILLAFIEAVAAAAVVTLVWTVATNVRTRRHVAQRKVDAAALRASAARDLEEGVRALLGRSFAARLPDGRLLLHTPHLAWATSRIRDLRRSGRTPDVVTLERDLKDLAVRLQAAEDDARREPPAEWADLDGGADLGPFAARWDGLGLRRPREESGRWAALGL
jgi:hypothetical protein